jgi:hypothetical protein
MARTLSTIIVSGLLFISTGCNIFNPPPSEAAFLEGTWTVTPEDPGDFEDIEFEAVFNSNGVLITLRGTRDDGATATLNISGSATTIDGDDITVTVPGDNATVTFEGTVSEDQNTITGSTTQDIDLGDLDISLPGGELTLERQE